MKIIIDQDVEIDMLRISLDDGTCLFYGNLSDFDRSGSNFKKLFEQIGLNVELNDVDLGD